MAYSSQFVDSCIYNFFWADRKISTFIHVHRFFPMVAFASDSFLYTTLLESNASLPNSIPSHFPIPPIYAKLPNQKRHHVPSFFHYLPLFPFPSTGAACSLSLKCSNNLVLLAYPFPHFIHLCSPPFAVPFPSPSASACLAAFFARLRAAAPSFFFGGDGGSEVGGGSEVVLDGRGDSDDEGGGGLEVVLVVGRCSEEGMR